MRYIIILLLVLLAIAMGSCSPNSKLRRAKRLIEKAEAAGAVWETDTVFSEIKVIVPETKFDTIVNIQSWTDTITVTKDRVTTRVVVTPSEKVVYIESKCDSVVIEKEVPVTVTKTIHAGPTLWQSVKMFLIGFAAGVILCGAYRLLR